MPPNDLTGAPLLHVQDQADFAVRRHAVAESIHAKSAQMLERQQHVDANGHYRPPAAAAPQTPAS
ncbi:hypothetical protein GCM10009745_24440 [Kribbella yunnanensis]|uniref:Uncharacterized protein n=1 Tax=Kribbella yunnanensis TaxID=190194 RepID=A0ABP4SZ76_9ACTN